MSSIHLGIFLNHALSPCVYYKVFNLFRDFLKHSLSFYVCILHSLCVYTPLSMLFMCSKTDSRRLKSFIFLVEEDAAQTNLCRDVHARHLDGRHGHEGREG